LSHVGVLASGRPFGSHIEGVRMRPRSADPKLPLSATGAKTGEASVYKHILIATDGSELAGKAVAAGFELARQLEAQVTVVTVTEPWTAFMAGDAAFGFPIDDYETSANESATAILAGASKLARKAGITCATVHGKDQFPSEGILQAAAKNNCDLIVMASHGRRGLGRLLLGSVAAKVATYSTVPVLICR
jgi:nucleotide-binding universal stress UspA family protein